MTSRFGTDTLPWPGDAAGAACRARRARPEEDLLDGTRPRTKLSAVGVVTDLTGEVIFGGYGSSRHAVSYPRVRFQTADGRTIEFRSKTGTNAPPQVGDEVTVYYDPERPEEASIAFASAFKFNPKVALVAAGAMVLGLFVFAFLAFLVVVLAIAIS
jgi:hypothetical protein